MLIIRSLNLISDQSWIYQTNAGQKQTLALWQTFLVYFHEFPTDSYIPVICLNLKKNKLRKA